MVDIFILPIVLYLVDQITASFQKAPLTNLPEDQFKITL